MATRRVSILPLLLPDTSGAIFWQPSSVLDTNDRFPHEVLVATDSGTKLAASGQFPIPKDYSSATADPKIIIVWRTSATAGDVRWTVALTPVGGDNAESMDPSTDTETGGVTDTAGGAAMRRMECSITLTKANYAADDSCLVTIARDGTAAADTLAASAILEDVLFEYADA